MKSTRSIYCSFMIILIATTFFASSIYGQGKKHALLVGVTDYPQLNKAHWLVGPQNDAALVESILRKRFGFSEEAGSLRVLVQDNEPKFRPTRANIVREFEELVGKVKTGDLVFILMSGHGTQQPNTNPEEDPETDNLDEVFCPSDISAMEASDKGIPNGIVDDQIHDWINALTSSGAFVWIMFDSCHSGTAVRGTNSEVARQIKPNVLVPKDRMQAAADAIVENTKPGPLKSQTFELTDSAGLVAMYGARPSEQAIEKELPESDGKVYGIMTFAIGLALENTQEPMTFAELMSQVRFQYQKWGRNSPTPIIEGTALNQVIFGREKWKDRSTTAITKISGDTYTLNVGKAHGIHAGTVFRVLPKSLDSDEVLTQLEIVKSEFYNSRAKIKAEAAQPADGQLEIGCRCLVDYYKYEAPVVRVAIDKESFENQKEADDLEEKLRTSTADKSTLFALTDQLDKSDWMVRAVEDKVQLVPAGGVPKEQVENWSNHFQFAKNDSAAETISSALNKIAKVKNLLQIAGKSSDFKSDVKVDFSIVRVKDEDDRVGTPIEPTPGGLELSDGEFIGFKVENKSSCSVDLTMLFVDSACGIEAYIPEDLFSEKHVLPPKESRIFLPSHIEAEETSGKERMVLIATRTGPTPIDFTQLAQPRIESVKGSLRGGDDDELASLFSTMCFGAGTTRGLKPHVAKDYMIQSIEWTTVK